MPFLEVDYFKEVESPYQVIENFSKKFYKWKIWEPGMKLDHINSALLVKFKKINKNRPEILRTHDKIIEEIYQTLKNSKKDWIFVYTARKALKADMRNFRNCKHCFQ